MTTAVLMVVAAVACGEGPDDGGREGGTGMSLRDEAAPLAAARRADSVSLAVAGHDHPAPERVALLGDPDGPGLLPGLVSSVFRDGRGRVWVGFHGGEPPMVFEADGSSAFPVGRSGQGPGEIQGDVLLGDGGGSRVAVLDRWGARLSLFFEEGDYLDGRPLVTSGADDFVVLPDGSVVVSQLLFTADAAGYPLHLYVPDASAPVRSFGAVMPVLTPDNQLGLARLLAAGGADGVWALHRLEPRLELWRTDGTLVRTLDLPGGALPPPPRSDRIPADHTPFPYFYALRLEDGLLWTTALVIRDDWEEGLRMGMRADGSTDWVVDDPSRVADVLLQVVTCDGRLVHRERIEAVAPVLLGDGYLSTVQGHREDLTPVLEVWRTGFRRPEGLQAAPCTP